MERRRHRHVNESDGHLVTERSHHSGIYETSAVISRTLSGWAPRGRLSINACWGNWDAASYRTVRLLWDLGGSLNFYQSIRYLAGHGPGDQPGGALLSRVAGPVDWWTYA